MKTFDSSIESSLQGASSDVALSQIQIIRRQSNLANTDHVFANIGEYQCSTHDKNIGAVLQAGGLL